MNTILIAEDDEHISNLIELNLKDCDYNILKAQNGIEAYTMFQNNEISLMLIDVIMPGLDGFNLLRKIRETSFVPAIFLTSRAEEIDRVIGLGLGADDYLTKPFAMEELKARISATLRRCYNYTGLSENQNSIISNGNITVDTSSYICTVNNNPVVLNAKEIKLLIYFMENMNKVFTTKQLYRAVWDDEYMYDDNTIRVHISNIRNKIDPEKSIIRTVRGIGYKMVEVNLN